MRHGSLRTLACVVALLFAACGGGSSGGSGGGSGKQALGHEARLARLGIDTELADRNGPHPLGTPIAVLDPVCEVFRMSGGPSDAGVAVVHEDGKSSTPWREIWRRDGEWAKTNYKNAIAADVDGDGLDEIVIAYLVDLSSSTADLRVKILDRGAPGSAANWQEHDRLVTAGLTKFSLPDENYTGPGDRHLPTLAKGDADGDSREEIAIGLWSLYVLDFPASGYDFQVRSQTYSTTWGGAGQRTDMTQIFVAMGDLDGSGTAEVVASHGATFDVFRFDGDSLTPAFNGWDEEVIPTDHGLGFAMSAGNVAIGDVDGDGRNEVVCHSAGFSSSFALYQTVVTALGLAASGDEFEAVNLRAVTSETKTPLSLPWAGVRVDLELLDFDGDGSLEILAGQRLWRYAESPVDYFGGGIGWGAIELGSTEPIEVLHNFAVGAAPFPHVAVADVNGDRRDDIVFSWYASGRAGVRAWGMDDRGVPTRWDIVPSTASRTQPRVCLPNLDEDSAVVEYTGDHELLFSDIEILTVMACPPYHKKIGQVGPGIGTTVGRTHSQQTASEESLAVSVGFSVGVKAEAPFLPIGAESHLKMSIGTEVAKRATTRRSITIAYSSGPGEDKVVFTAFPFDVYYYRVLDPGSIPELEKDAILTISVPRKPQILSVSRAFFNATNGDYPDVDETVFSHRIGDIDSYPRGAPALSWRSPTTWVGQGTGDNSATLEEERGIGTKEGLDFTVETESKVQAGPVVVGAYSSFSLGYSYEVTNTSATFYQGTVGNIPSSIPSSDVWRYTYSWGICVYPLTRGDETFTVVNYWVE